MTISSLLDRLNDDGDIRDNDNLTITTSMPNMTLANNVNCTADSFYFIPFKFVCQHKSKVIEQFDQLFNKISANNTYVLFLFGLGFVIALGGLIAILCQLHCWARSRRQRLRKERELR